MVLYTCEWCNKEFKKKCDYERHCNKKTPCDDKKAPQDSALLHKSATQKKHNDKIIRCELCKKQFTRKDTLKRHQVQFCKPSISIEQQLKELRLIVETLQKTNKQLIPVSKPDLIPQVVNNTNNVIITNNTTVVLRNFGGENYRNIPEETLIQVVNSGHNFIYSYVDNIRFNKLENMNVYMKSAKDKEGYVYEEGWKKKEAKIIGFEILDDIQFSMYDLLEQPFISKCDPVKVKEVNEVLEKTYNGCNRDYDSSYNLIVNMDNYCTNFYNYIINKIEHVSTQVPFTLQLV